MRADHLITNTWIFIVFHVSIMSHAEMETHKHKINHNII